MKESAANDRAWAKPPPKPPPKPEPPYPPYPSSRFPPRAGGLPSSALGRDVFLSFALFAFARAALTPATATRAPSASATALSPYDDGSFGAGAADA